MDDIEQLLEGGKAEAAAQKAKLALSPSNGHRDRSGDEGKSDRKRDAASPSARSHSSSHRSQRRRRDRSATPRGDRARSHSRDSNPDRDSRRSSRRPKDDVDDEHRSSHSSSSKRDRDNRGAGDRDDDRKRRRRSPSPARSRHDNDDRRRSSHRSSRRDDSRERDRDRNSGRRDRDDRDRRSYGRDRDNRDRRDSRRDERDAPREGSPAGIPRMTEEDHEARSVFVTQLAARIGDRELFQFFEQNIGKVRDARVILDRVSRRSKGVAYVEFMDIDDVRKAINLTGTKLLGIPIVVQYTEAERNRQAGLTQRPQNIPEHITIPAGSDARGDAPVPYNRIYVGSLPFSLRENDIRQIFEPFGLIDSIDLHFDNITQKSKGYCFVQYRKLADAQQALERMNGFEIAGRPIRVGLVTEKGSSNTQPNAGGMAPGSMRQGGGGMQRPDSLEEGASLNSISRIELMQKLARSEPAGGLAAPTQPMFRVNVPSATSKSVLLKHMFDPAEETEKDWDLELRDDVKGECESKYGPVAEIHVDKESAIGEIYVRFTTLDTAAKAIQGLNGRFFGGQQISAQYISDALFDAHRK